MNRARLLLVVLVFMGATLPVRASGQQQGRALALTNATLIDGTGAAPRPGTTVLIEGGKIAQIFPSGQRPLSPSTEMLDLRGQYLIPGLINTHLHLPMLGWSRGSVATGLERMLRAGVTTVREMAGDARLAAELDRARLIEGAPFPTVHWAVRLAGPTFYESGAGSASWIGYDAGTAPWAQSVKPGMDISRTVALAAGTGATGIKIYTDLGPDLVRRLIQEAHRQGLRAWAHGTIFPTSPLEAVRAGIDGLSHTCLLFLGLQPDVPAQRSDMTPIRPQDIDWEEGPFRDLIREMSARGVVMDATARNGATGRGARRAGCTPELQNRALRAMHHAGIPISTGTDYYIAEGEPDPTLFKEVEYLVESGVLSPAEAITAATLNGARALGIDSSYGSIEPGKVADLVVLSADPTKQISALRQVVEVMKHGKRVVAARSVGSGR